jgi:hypothetical protein
MPNDVTGGSATFIKRLKWPASYPQLSFRRLTTVFGRLLSCGLTHGRLHAIRRSLRGRLAGVNLEGLRPNEPPDVDVPETHRKYIASRAPRGLGYTPNAGEPR